MEKLGVVSRIEEPTPWCAAMVVVPKPSGSVRICVDLKPKQKCDARDPPVAKSRYKSSSVDRCQTV